MTLVIERLNHFVFSLFQTSPFMSHCFTYTGYFLAYIHLLKCHNGSLSNIRAIQTTVTVILLLSMRYLALFV